MSQEGASYPRGQGPRFAEATERGGFLTRKGRIPRPTFRENPAGEHEDSRPLRKRRGNDKAWGGKSVGIRAGRPDRSDLVVAFVLAVLAMLGVAAPAQAAPGDLDLSFGEGGATTTVVPYGNDQLSGASAEDLAVQPDGKVVVAGSAFDPGDFALARFDSDGSLDETFDGDGRLTTAVGDLNDSVGDLALQADGKIVTATIKGGPSGSTDPSGNALERDKTWSFTVKR